MEMQWQLTLRLTTILRILRPRKATTRRINLVL
jgi:hypothetical protein